MHRSLQRREAYGTSPTRESDVVKCGMAVFQQGSYPTRKHKNAKNKDTLKQVCLSMVLNFFGDMDPFGHLVTLILRIMFLIAENKK